MDNKFLSLKWTSISKVAYIGKCLIFGQHVRIIKNLLFLHFVTQACCRGPLDWYESFRALLGLVLENCFSVGSITGTTCISRKGSLWNMLEILINKNTEAAYSYKIWWFNCSKMILLDHGKGFYGQDTGHRGFIWLIILLFIAFADQFAGFHFHICMTQQFLNASSIS